MRYILLIIIFNLSYQSVLSLGFLREFFFPRNPILHRVRNSNSGRSVDTNKILDFVGLVESEGYPGEEHHLTTEDGYKLILHRIPGSQKSPPKTGKPILFLQHGLFGSSDTWVLMGAHKDLAFMMADEGYDIWLGNVRGNTYGRSHQQLLTTDREFWTFSYHEHAIYDLAAMIDYCLHLTGEKTIAYIGHSMGTTMSYALLSTKPSYNEKIKLVISLAPVAIWKSPPNVILYPVYRTNFEIIKRFFDKNDIYDLFPQTDNNAKFVEGICSSNTIGRSSCSALIFHLAGYDPDQFNSSLLPHIARYFPAGSSVQTTQHYVQNVDNGIFQQYDFGYSTNYKIYGKKRPFNYDLKKVTAPVALIYSKNDLLVPIENVMELKNKLPNVCELYRVSDHKFNHLDYIWAKDAKKILYHKIFNIISKY